VVGGRLSGRAIRCPPGLATRPTLDRVRESLFNILAPRVAGALVLDLYAGTGALAFEALSRGAEHAAVVEPDPRALGVLRANVTALGLEERTTIYPVRAEQAVKRLGEHAFHLIFLDPPWDRGPSGDV
jgi:16S rRNA (guanine966-N2)-methyltransferase